MVTQILSGQIVSLLNLRFIVNQIEQVSPGFSEKYLMKPDIFSNEIEQYRKYISAMVSTFDPNVIADEFANDIVKFSTDLAQVIYFVYLNIRFKLIFVKKL